MRYKQGMEGKGRNLGFGHLRGGGRGAEPARTRATTRGVSGSTGEYAGGSSSRVWQKKREESSGATEGSKVRCGNASRGGYVSENASVKRWNKSPALCHGVASRGLQQQLQQEQVFWVPEKHVLSIFREQCIS